MAKRAVAKTGEYINQQQETKGEYTRVGVVLNNENGEYMLLDPTVSLAGILAKQNALAMKLNKPLRDNVMISFFEDDNQDQGQAPQQQGGGNGQAPQPNYHQQQTPPNYQGRR